MVNRHTNLKDAGRVQLHCAILDTQPEAICLFTLRSLLRDTATCETVSSLMVYACTHCDHASKELFLDVMCEFPSLFKPHASEIARIAINDSFADSIRLRAADTLHHLLLYSPHSVDTVIGFLRMPRTPEQRSALKQLLRKYLSCCPDREEAERLRDFVIMTTCVRLTGPKRIEAIAKLDWIGDVLRDIHRLLRRHLQQSFDTENLSDDILAELVIQLTTDPYLGICRFSSASLKIEVRKKLSNAVTRYIRKELKTHTIRPRNSGPIDTVMTDPALLADVLVYKAGAASSAIDQAERNEAVRYAINTSLTQDEMFVLRERIESEKTRKQIGIDSGFTQSKIRALETSAKEKLKAALSHLTDV